MEVTVLGACGTYPSAGGACSGYLLRHGGFSMWVDAGTGTMAGLQEHLGLDEVDAIYVSHMHPDHFVDLYPMLYALSFRRGGPRTIPVYAPSCGPEMFARLMSDTPRGDFPKVFDWQPLKAGDATEIGPFSVRVFDAAHSIENLTLRAEAGGRVFAYSGDTGPTPHLAQAAKDADLFLCEASWQDGESSISDPIHLFARQAGRVAKEAGADRLVLTHIWPVYDLETSAGQAAEEFDGRVEVATTHARWTV